MGGGPIGKSGGEQHLVSQGPGSSIQSTDGTYEIGTADGSAELVATGTLRIPLAAQVHGSTRVLQGTLALVGKPGSGWHSAGKSGRDTSRSIGVEANRHYAVTRRVE